jgi:cytochrome P450
MSAATLPPGPRLAPLVQTAWWLARPVSFMQACGKRHGDAFSLRFLGFERPMVMISDPEAIRALYGERAHNLPPGRRVALLPVMGESSLLLLEGEEHLARRRAMLPAFHGERMRSYEAIMRELTEAEIERWPLGRPFALHPRMQGLTLEVIMRAVFGVSDPVRRAALRERLQALLSRSASARFQLRVVLAGRTRSRDPLARLRALREEVDGLLREEIAARRRAGALEEREDILSLLMGVRMEDGERMSAQELCDQLITLLLAGHETTATALAWTFDLLLCHPDALARLAREVREGEHESYLRAVISESLRLRPVVPLAGRRLAVELAAGGLRLPAGTDVTPGIWLTHTRADLYPDPLAFRPERFLESPPGTYGWIPFGGGVRRCLGAAFAEYEMRVVLGTVLRRCTLAPARHRAEAVRRRNVTLSPRHGMLVRLLARRERAVRSTDPVAA